MNTPDKRPISFYVLLTLLFFQSASGLYGGAALILDPTGNFLQLPTTLLEGTPFQDFLIPGIILFTVLGVFPLIVFVGSWQQKIWAWPGAMLVSIALIIWIGVQIAMIGYESEPPLQLIYGLVGGALLILTQLPAVRTLLQSKSIHHETNHLVHQHPVYSYFIIVFAISWIGSLVVAGPSFLREEDISTTPFLLMLVFMLAGPSITGILLTHVVDGKGGLQDLFQRMQLWKTELKWYGFAVLIPLILILITLYLLSMIISPTFQPGFFVVGIIYGLLAGYFEEVGWMGYAYPKMKQSLGTFKAAIILGLAWGIWHIVASYLGSFNTLQEFWLPSFLALWIIGMTAMRILIVWVYQNTQSILMCQLMHASSTGFLAALSPTSLTPAQVTLWYVLYAGMLWLIVMVIAYTYGRDLNQNKISKHYESIS